MRNIKLILCTAIMGITVLCLSCGTSYTVTETFDKDGKRTSKTITSKADTLHHKAFNMTSTTYGAKIVTSDPENPFPTLIIGFESLAVNAVPVVAGQGFEGKNTTKAPFSKEPLNEMNVKITEHRNSPLPDTQRK